jgi:Ni,Fe-hydrogenase III large subunit
VRRDITPEIKQDILNVLKTIEEEMVVIKNAIIGDTSIHKRTKEVGHITKEDTIKWSLVGPVARARGVDIDVRRDHPYAAYDDMQFSVPVVDSCDVWGTVLVRVLETFEAINIVRQALDKLPDDGPILTEMDEAIKPFSHAIAGVEAPRGEVVHYIITGEDNRPERWRVRAPTYPNLQGVPLMLLNNELADAPIIIGSIDPCFSCTERVEVVDINNGGVKVFSRSELERMAQKKH